MQVLHALVTAQNVKMNDGMKLKEMNHCNKPGPKYKLF